jgi:hypothetical protein
MLSFFYCYLFVTSISYLPWLSGQGSGLTILSLSFNSQPGDQYLVLVSGLLAEILSDHKAWWTPLAEGKMVMHLLVRIA